MEATGNEATIRVNGVIRLLRSSPLIALLREMGHLPGQAGVAVAVNGEVVRRLEWAQRELRSGDVVEIVGAVQGG